MFFAGEITSGANIKAQWTPKLIITTVPEPPTLAILALGIIGLASRRFN
ncbi:PEP-CTERM sorting domain-containing protein [Colwellia sp. PAMC 20917]|nr:PEP-CTERM sorting domain-containing protein [Colwellia sp. PAMC 20917]